MDFVDSYSTEVSPLPKPCPIQDPSPNLQEPSNLELETLPASKNEGWSVKLNLTVPA